MITSYIFVSTKRMIQPIFVRRLVYWAIEIISRVGAKNRMPVSTSRVIGRAGGSVSGLIRG